MSCQERKVIQVFHYQANCKKNEITSKSLLKCQLNDLVFRFPSHLSQEHFPVVIWIFLKLSWKQALLHRCYIELRNDGVSDYS